MKICIHPQHLGSFLQATYLSNKPGSPYDVGSMFAGVDSFRKSASEGRETSAAQAYMEKERGQFVAPYLFDLGNGVADLVLEGGVYQLTTREDSWYSDYIISNRLAQAAIRRALTDDNIKAVRVRVNSPGGTVVGTPETARTLALLSSNKPVIASVDNMAASAGYWIVSACSTIYATPSADLASVGVYSIHLDMSKTYEAWYESTMTLVRSGDRKAEMLREMTPEMLEAWQAETDSIWAEFKDAVRSARGEVTESLLQGQCLTGAEAFDAGLVDALTDDPDGDALKDLLAML